MSAPATIRDPLIGARIDGRYLVHGVLGRGGMGVVYDGEHEQLGRPVAIKVLGPGVAGDPVAVQRFLREARTASRLTHGNIVDVSDLGNLPDGRPYLVMPKLHGVDLSSLLQQQGPQTPRRTCELLRGAAAALDLIHAKGFVHRDVKPENLMHVVHEDGSEAVLLLDFGIVGLISPDSARLTAEGVVFGTPAYIAPEVVRGDAPGPRSDIYALATVAFELITGQTPFSAANVMQLLQLKLGKDAPSMSQVACDTIPDEIEAVLRQSLARDPRARHASAGAFVAALEAALQRTGAIAGAAAGPRAGRLDTEARQRLQDGTGELELSLSEAPPAPVANDAPPQPPASAAAHTKARPVPPPSAAKARPAPLRAPPPAAAGPGRPRDPKLQPAADLQPLAAATQAAREPAGLAAQPPDAADARASTADPQRSPATEPDPPGAQAASGGSQPSAAGAPGMTRTDEAEPPGSITGASRTRAIKTGAAALAVALFAATGWALTRSSEAPRQHVVTPLPAAVAPAAVASPPAASPELSPTPEGHAPPQPPAPAPAASRPRAAPTAAIAPRKPEPPATKAPVEAPPPQPTAATPTAPARAEAAPVPPSAAETLKQAQTELIQGHLVLAADLYERATRTDPSSAAAFRGLGLVSERLGRKDDAIRALRRAISLAPADPKNALLEARIRKLEGS